MLREPVQISSVVRYQRSSQWTVNITYTLNGRPFFGMLIQGYGIMHIICQRSFTGGISFNFNSLEVPRSQLNSWQSANEDVRAEYLLRVYVHIYLYFGIRIVDTFHGTFFSHLLRAIVYLFSVALRSQDVKLNNVSWDHYLINEPPLKCEGVQK